jgi:hypothetical protein
MGNFKLVNPVIIGTFVDTYDTSNADQAAKKFWDTLTTDNKYVTGNIPKFLFTLMDTSSKDLFHYMVREKPEGKNADYSITKVNVEMTSQQKKEFFNEIEKIKNDSDKMLKTEQAGGKRRRYEDDSSSSESDVDDLFRYIKLRNVVKPISYWWYTPALYNIDTIFTPNFVAPISPYVQLWMPIR